MSAPRKIYYQKGFLQEFVEELPGARKDIPAVEYIRADLAPTLPSADYVAAIEDIRTHRANWKHAVELVRDNCPLPTEDQDDRIYWEHQIRSLDQACDTLRALAGKGE